MLKKAAFFPTQAKKTGEPPFSLHRQAQDIHAIALNFTGWFTIFCNLG